MRKPLESFKNSKQDTILRLIAGALYVGLAFWLYPQLSTSSFLVAFAVIGFTLGMLCWSSFKTQQTLQRELTIISSALAPLLPSSASNNDDEQYTTSVAHNIQQQLEKIATAQQSFGDISENVLEQTRHTQQAVTQATDAIEQQHEQSQLATQSMDTIRNAFGSMLDSADETLEVSKKSEEEGDSGKLVMTEAMSGIMALGDSVNKTGAMVDTLGNNSEAIGGIVNVIKSVAEQTNLLALNAAIEAARAGEQGRGFAVVADEVRSLANKTQESAQEIEDLIQQLLRNVESANSAIQGSMKLAERSDELIESVVISYSEIVGHMTEIETLAKTMTSTAAQGQQNANDAAQNLQQLESTVSNSREQLNLVNAASNEVVSLLDSQS